MPFDRKTDTYIPEFAERLKVVPFEPTIIPGINDLQLDQTISVDSSALTTPYDNSDSWLSATNVKSALDELYSDIQALNCP